MLLLLSASAVLPGSAAAPTAERGTAGLSFAPLSWSPYPVYTRIGALAWGDLDDDGRLDLALGSTSPLSAFVYLNRNGEMEKFPEWESDEQSAIRGLALGDLNGDGHLDMICASSYRPNRMYLNRVTGAAWSSHDSLNSFAVVLGDVDNDGDLDPVFCNSTQPLQMFRNDGGTLTEDPVWQSAGGEDTRKIALGDVDGDGRLDLVCANYYGDVPGTQTVRFGAACAAGDLNGDGASDLVVASNDEVYLFYGGAEIDAIADVTISIGRSLGDPIAVAGDFNGDGFDDLIVGQYSDDTGGYDAGRVSVYFGGSRPDTTPDMILSGAPGDQLGRSVAGAGDINGDGFADFLVGAPYSDTGVPSWSSGQPHVTMSVAVGDVDADGDLDLVCGNSRWHNTLYLNRDGVLDTQPAWISEPTNDTRSVALGDVDGDGDLDLVCGNRQNNTLYLNRAGVLDTQPAWVSEPINDTRSVALGDVDGDGDLDLACGNYSPGNALYLNQDGVLAVRPAWTSEPTSPTQGVALGDVDGDGDLDLVCGNNRGGNTLFSNEDGMLSTHPAWISEPGHDTRSVALGDVDGDGDLDLVCGNFGASNTLFLNESGVLGIQPVWSSGPGNSTSSVALGDIDGDGRIDLVCGNQSQIQVNTMYLNDAGRFAGAGKPDVGRVFVHLGGPTANSTADFVLTEPDARNYFGLAASGAGDVNDDGFDDFVVGSGAGRAFLYYGGSAPDTTPDLIFTSQEAGDSFGGRVSKAGDVNGDGYADLLIAASSSNARDYAAGRAYIYYGGPEMDATPDLVLTGEARFDRFGEFVSPAGDVNGDGFDDVLVGASNNDAGGSSAGRAYVYFGGRAPDTTVDLVLTGEAAGDRFAYSLLDAGDVNGDGFDDLLIGAYGNDGGGLGAGAAYLFFGGPAPDAGVDLRLAGPDGFLLSGGRYSLYLNRAGGFGATPDWRSEFSQFSESLALGDVDGDGDLDLVIGGRYAILNSVPGRFGVFHNDIGVFPPEPVLFGEPRRNISLALADIDEDGDLDVLSGNAPNAEIYLNNDGAFGSAADLVLDTELSIADIVPGDADDDGDLDLALSSGQIFRNESFLGFSVPFVWSADFSEGSHGVALGDVNQDGLPDLAFANQGANTVYISESWTLPRQPTWKTRFESETRAVTLGRVTRDRFPDLACGNFNTFSALYSALTGSSPGQPSWSPSSSARTTSIALTDLDGDGDLDLVLGNEDERNQFVLNDNGSLRSEFEAWTTASPLNTQAVAAGDIDGDGDPDLIFANKGHASTLYENVGGTFSSQPAWSADSARASTSVALGDIDGDGRIDALFGNVGGKDVVYLNRRGLLPQQPDWELGTGLGAGDPTSSVALEDIDGDGDLDAVCGAFDGSLKVYRNSAGRLSGKPDWISWAGAGRNTRGIILGDLDGDGDADLAAANFAGPNTVHAGLRNPAYRWDPAAPTHHLPNNPAVIRHLTVHETSRNVHRFQFTVFDAESDSVWLWPEYRASARDPWQPLPVAGSPRIGALAASPEGVTHTLDWDVTPLPQLRLELEFRFRWISAPSRTGIIRRTGAYFHRIDPLVVKRPVAVIREPIVSFPTVCVGDTTVAGLLIANSGTDILNVLALESPEPDYRSAVDFPLRIAPGSSQSVPIRLTPIAVPPAGGSTLRVLTDDPVNPSIPVTAISDVRDLRVDLRPVDPMERVPLGEALAFLVSPLPDVNIERGWLVHRPVHAASFADSIPLRRLASDYIVTVPGNAITESGLDYYVRLENSGVTRTMPPGAPDGGVFTQLVQPPSAISTAAQRNSSAGYLAGLSVTVLVSLPQGTVFRSGRLHYRPGGALLFEEEELVNRGLFPEAVIPADVVGERGVEYWAEVVTESGSRLMDPPVNPTGRPLALRTTVTNLEEPESAAGGRYRMVSIPLDFGEDFQGTLVSLLSDQIEFGPYDPVKWRSFRWSPADSAYFELSDEGREGHFRPEPGRALWLIAGADHRINTAPITTGLSTPTDSSYLIKLESGWNQIGNPFAFPVAWDDVSVSGVPLPEHPLVPSPVGWDPSIGSTGDYDFDEGVLRPFTGYWILNIGADSLVLEIPPVETAADSGAVEARSLPGADALWTLSIQATASGVHDRINHAGVSPAANSGLDRLDQRDPPLPPGRALSVYFPHGDWPLGAGPYASDFRESVPDAVASPEDASGSAGGHTWAFDVVKNFSDHESGDAILLEFDLGHLPPHHEAVLHDRQLERFVDLGREPRHRFLAGTRAVVNDEARARFALHAGSAAFVRRAIGQTDRSAFSDRLLQCAPNPFRSATRIRYEVARPGPVSITIHDVQGRLIRTVVDGLHDAGRYEEAWLGEDDGGRTMPPGIYFCRITIGGAAQTRKMVRTG